MDLCRPGRRVAGAGAEPAAQAHSQRVGRPTRGLRHAGALAGAATAAGLFLLAGSLRLEAQGAQYDELNQAVGAFELAGRPAPIFARGRVLGLPLLVQPWSGALKTHLFGAALAATGADFTVARWRAFGLVLSAAGLMLLLLALGRHLSWAQRAVLAALLISDTTLLLHSRHEVGPVALSFALRAAFLALAVRAGHGAQRARLAALGLGLLVGLSVYDKLSSVVLLWPLALACAAFPGLRSRGALGACLLGLALGAAPLLAANATSWAQHGLLVSAEGALVRQYPEVPLSTYLWKLASLGAGDEAGQMILGVGAPGWVTLLEALSATAALLAAAAGAAEAARSGQGLAWPRVSGALLASWAGVAAGMAALPKGTAEHHWLLAAHLLALEKSHAYVVALEPPPLSPARASRIFDDAQRWPGWRQVAAPLELEVPGVRILALERR